MTAPIDTLNKFLVGRAGEKLVIGFLPGSVLSQDDALLLAAYLVLMCDDRKRWDEMLAAVENA